MDGTRIQDVDYVIQADQRSIFYPPLTVKVPAILPPDVCGTFLEEVFYNDTPVTDTTTPLANTPDPNDTTMLLQSSELALIDTTATIKIRGTLSDYPDITFEMTSTITYLDPCDSPFGLTSDS